MEHEDPISAVQRYIEGFNRGDVEAMAATFAERAAILDGMAPHLWLGPNTSRDWYRDALAEGEQHGVSDYLITLGEPLHNDVTGESAYLVLPATFSYKLRGKEVTQTGASFTVALTRLPDGWRISAWAWTKGRQQ